MYHYKTIKIEINKRVGVIEFNRPEVMNAFNEEMVGEVTSAMKELNNDKSVACIIIKGNGRCFSAGFDMKEASQKSLKGKTQWKKELTKDFDFTMQFWHSKKPTIAAVHGYCLAGAFEVMLACDISIAEEKTFLGEPEVRFGSGIIAMLAPWVTGPKQAKEILLTGNDRLTANQCLQMGLLNYVEKGESVFQKSFDIARQICMASERSVQLTKQSINQSFEYAGFKKALSNSLEIDTEIESDESPERLLFNKIRKEQGLKKALEWRDSKFK